MSRDPPYALRYSALPGADEDVEGWLLKEGRSLRAKRSRYVRLRGSVLSSHRNRYAPPSWEVAVTNATVSRGSTHEWAIILDLPSKRVSLVAACKTDFERWIFALRRASSLSSRVEDYYCIRHMVGEGMNGKVRLANDLITDETVAIKTVPRLGRDNEDMFLAREVKIMLSMSHPNIVRTFDVFVRRKRIHFVMEYVPGGELFDLIAEHTNFTEAHAASVMHDLLSAIAYLHANGIAHRDVKLENLLCMRTTWPLHVKLADFGFANYIRSDRDNLLSSFVGTPYYIAPEMLRGKGHGRPVDVWACGVVMYILLSGKFPFGGNGEKEYYARVLSTDAYFPAKEWDHVSASAKHLVRGMLDKDPSKRLTAEQCLNHPWLQCVRATAETATTSSLTRTQFSQDQEKQKPMLLSPAMFRNNRSKQGRSRNQGMLNSSLSSPHPSSSGHTVLPPNDRQDPAAKDASVPGFSNAAQVGASPRSSIPGIALVDNNFFKCHKPLQASKMGNLPDASAPHPARYSAARHSGNFAPSSRRPSLIRRLLSSGRLSLDRYDARFPSFRGNGEDAEDEATAMPRKTISLFGKLSPIRRSFHRSRADDLPGMSGDGINFVDSQNVTGAKRLPPKLAREQLRLAAQERKASRRGLFRFRRGSNVDSGRSLSASFGTSSGGTPSHPSACQQGPGTSSGNFARENIYGPRHTIDGFMSRNQRPTPWGDSHVPYTIPSRSPVLSASPSLRHSSSEPPSGKDPFGVNNTPLSQRQMSIILGYDDAQSNSSLSPSSGSAFGCQWSTSFSTAEQKRSPVLSA